MAALNDRSRTERAWHRKAENEKEGNKKAPHGGGAL